MWGAGASGRGGGVLPARLEGHGGVEDELKEGRRGGAGGDAMCTHMNCWCERAPLEQSPGSLRGHRRREVRRVFADIASIGLATPRIFSQNARIHILAIHIGESSQTGCNRHSKAHGAVTASTPIWLMDNLSFAAVGDLFHAVGRRSESPKESLEFVVRSIAEVSLATRMHDRCLDY